jgi:hypothetical protein
MSHPFTIETEYEILDSYPGMRTGFWLYTVEGVLVFVAGDNEDPNWRDKKRLPGRYVSSCVIPPSLLNSGKYSLSVAADIPGYGLLFFEQTVLSFVLEHTEASILDGANRSPGIICPSLKWKIAQISGH